MKWLSCIRLSNCFRFRANMNAVGKKNIAVASAALSVILDYLLVYTLRLSRISLLN